MKKRSAYADLFIRLAGGVMQCMTCLRVASFVDFEASIAGGWQWELQAAPAGTRIAWTCRDCRGAT